MSSTSPDLVEDRDVIGVRPSGGAVLVPTHPCGPDDESVSESDDLSWTY